MSSVFHIRELENVNLNNITNPIITWETIVVLPVGLMQRVHTHYNTYSSDVPPPTHVRAYYNM